MICKRSILARLNRAVGVLVTAGVTVAGGACASQTASLQQAKPIRGMPPLLTWISEFTRPAGTVYPALVGAKRFGSISGLALDAATGQWVGVSDDRDTTRVAWLSFDFTGGKMTVLPTKMTPLVAGPGVEDRIVTKADLEAIVALPDGTFLMSEEGHTTEDGVWQPMIFHVTREGLVTNVIPFPENVQIRPDLTRGLRENRGFEGLTRTPDGRLIASLEQPLIEDGPMTSFDHGGRGRLIEFKPRRGGGYRPGRQWFYPIEPTQRVDGFPEICDRGENGVSELLALSNTVLLSLERACLIDPVTKQVMNPIQIFAVELSRTDLRKTLVLDLSTISKKMLSAELSRLDNFEGMAFGPTATNGTRTLLLVSDDNFIATQKTSYLLFGLR